MANFIDNIEIKNFKSIRHQKINDCRRVNLFIGYPNVGKSNIIEVLSLFSIDESDPDFSKFIRIQNLTTLFHDGNIGDQSEIRINEKHRIVVRFKKSELTFQHQFEKEGTSFEKNDIQKIFFDDSARVLVRNSFQINEDKKLITNYKFFGIGEVNELAQTKKYEFHKSIAFSSKEYSTLSHPNGDNLFNIIFTNSILNKEVAELFKPNNLELLYDTRIQKFTILKRTGSSIFSIPYELIADTLQRLIFYKAAISSNTNSVLLFEEPEAHMFPPYISKFTSDVWYKKDNQYFITTHSPFVVNDFLENAKDELAIFILDYQNGETIVKRLNEEQVHEAYQYGIDLFFNIQSLIE